MRLLEDIITIYNSGDDINEIYGKVRQDHNSEAWILGIQSYILAQQLRKAQKDIKLKVFIENEYVPRLELLLKSFSIENLKICELGALYGGLRRLNNFLNRDDIGITIKEIRSFVFNECIENGRVKNNVGDSKLTYDILLACTPFGLFEPEDLVLVATVKELEIEIQKASISEKLILANYYIEQGTYGRTKELIESIDIEKISDIEMGFLEILKESLEEKIGSGHISIIHKPFGNNNPYEPQIYERFPKTCLEGNIVVIQAQIWPTDRETKTFLNLCVNGNSQKIIGKEVMGVESYLRWEIGPFVYPDEITYYFEITKNESVVHLSFEYAFEVYRRESLTIKRQLNLEDSLVLEMETTMGEKSYIRIKDHFGQRITIESVEDNLVNLNTECLEPLRNYPLLNDIKISFIEDGLFVLSHEDKDIVVKNISLIYAKKSGTQRIEININMVEEEKFYGFGERYNTLNQRGLVIDNYVFNQYKDQGIRTYIPVPFYMSSSGYGCHIETTNYSWFDLGSTNEQEVIIGIEDKKLRLHFFIAPMASIINSFTELTGKPKLLPKWAFGPWMSSNNWDRQNEVEKQIELTLLHDIPATVLVIEAWSDEVTYYIFNDASYSKTEGDYDKSYSDYDFPKWGRWPNPKKMVQQLHEQNIKCILWQIPIIKNLSTIFHLQKEADEDYAIQHDYLIKNGDGSPYRIPENWFKDSYVIDFTNEEAKKWWFNKRKYLVRDIKVDGFKTDGGECVFGRDLQFHDGRNGEEMRNAYSNLYIKAYYDFINKVNPEGGITFSRSGYTGAQNSPAHWAGDERSTFEAFKRSLLAGLSCGLSGIPFWGWDFGGFSGDVPSDELFLRSAAMATFCPIMQYHAESKGEFNQDRTPWNIADRSNNPEVITMYRFFSKLRMNLLPYIYGEAEVCCLTGGPMMRALVLDYPLDTHISETYDEYLFGRSLLVAPIIEENQKERKMYFPKGKWTQFFQGEVVEGPVSVRVSSNWDEISVYIRDNSVIPLAFDHSIQLGSYSGNDIENYSILGLLCIGEDISEEVHLKEISGRKGKIHITKKGICIGIQSDVAKEVVILTLEEKIMMNLIASTGVKCYGQYFMHRI